MKNFPTLPQRSSAAVVVVIASSLWLSFWLGRRSSRAAAIASANAHAEARALAMATGGAAHSSAQVVINLDGTRGARAAGAAGGLDSAPWLVGRHHVAELDETEGVQAALDDVLDREELA
jgi:hypothetical protein